MGLVFHLTGSVWIAYRNRFFRFYLFLIPPLPSFKIRSLQALSVLAGPHSFTESRGL